MLTSALCAGCRRIIIWPEMTRPSATSRVSDHTFEFPGPILSIRPFRSLEHLEGLTRKDRMDNDMEKNLVSSVYTADARRFQDVQPLLSAHKVLLNTPTHFMNLDDQHQGILLFLKLADITNGN